MKNVFNKNRETSVIRDDTQRRYGATVANGFMLSGGTDNPAQGVHSYLRERNLPGQVISGYLANKRANSPQYKTNTQLARGGQVISPRQQDQTAEQALALVANMTSPVGGRNAFKKVPKIDPYTQDEMAGFIDYVRLRQPNNLQAEYEATRLAEHYGIPLPKTRAGLANQFDKVLTRQKRKGI